jgi:hypothetical protein
LNHTNYCTKENLPSTNVPYAGDTKCRLIKPGIFQTIFLCKCNKLMKTFETNVLKGPLCLEKAIIFIPQKRPIFWYLVKHSKNINLSYRYYYALLAIGIIVLN